MKSIFRLVVLLLLVVGWGLAALSLHVIRTPEQIPITLVPKDRFGFTDTYVDTRAWTLGDVAQHSALVERLIRIGKSDVLRHIVSDPHAGDVPTQLSEALQHAPKRDAHTSTQPITVEQTARSLWSW